MRLACAAALNATSATGADLIAALEQMPSVERARVTGEPGLSATVANVCTGDGSVTVWVSLVDTPGVSVSESVPLLAVTQSLQGTVSVSAQGLSTRDVVVSGSHDAQATSGEVTFSKLAVTGACDAYTLSVVAANDGAGTRSAAVQTQAFSVSAGAGYALHVRAGLGRCAAGVACKDQASAEVVDRGGNRAVWEQYTVRTKLGTAATTSGAQTRLLGNDSVVSQSGLASFASSALGVADSGASFTLRMATTPSLQGAWRRSGWRGGAAR